MISRFSLIGLCVLAAVPLSVQAESSTPKPKLIVAISVDQFSAGLFAQYRSRFTSGLKRMGEEGVVFPNGYQSHAATETCPGHSTLLTGRHPSATGIIANNWYDPAANRNVYCMEDTSVTVPGRPDAPRGPANLRVSTLGEWMKTANPASKVFAVSGKDRGAITMAGHNPDGVFWWDHELGFTTYVPKGASEAERLAPVKAFNAKLAEQWDKVLPVWTPFDTRCSKLSGKQAYGDLTIEHQVPPRWTHSGRDKPRRDDPAFKSWFWASPELDRITLDLAAHLVDSYRLGRGAAADLLAISLSATDYVGHRFGNQGPEMCDQMAHLDRELGSFFQKLDALKIPYVVALSADHGAVDAAERAARRGFPAERVSVNLMGETNKRVREELRLEFDPFKGDSTEFYVVREVNDAALRENVIATALLLLKQRSEVAAAFSKQEILKVKPPQDKPADELSLIERFAESTDAERSGDILIALKPYASLGKPSGDYVAGHGSPWNYDRRVPIVFWWRGALGFEQYLPIETVDIAPTLAALVGAPVPAVDGRCLDLDRGESSSCHH